jgi:hypothetical protein
MRHATGDAEVAKFLYRRYSFVIKHSGGPCFFAFGYNNRPVEVC